MGDLEKTEFYLQQALTIRQKVFGENHLDVARSLQSLSLLFLAQAKYEISENHLKRALSILENVLGKSHSKVAECYHNLAKLYHKEVF